MSSTALHDSIVPMAYAPHRAKLATPIGPIVIEGSADALTGITILPEDSTADDVIAAENGAVAEAVQQISAYFDGSLRQFDLPLTPSANPRGEYLRAAIAAIPYDAKLFGTAANNGQMLAEVDPANKTTEMIANVAKVVTGRAEVKRSKRSLLSPLMARLQKKKAS